MKIERASGWADAVFHVLAHVPAPGQATCFSPVYCTWIAKRIGPPPPELVEDAQVLAEIARNAPMGSFASAQALAWAFASPEKVAELVDRPLAQIRREEAADASALAIARSAAETAEVLRAAAELEAPRLPAIQAAREDAVEAALLRVTAAAPMLGRCIVALTPALGLRGRVHGERIFVGIPGIAEARVDHVAWQAAHEATVRETGDELQALALLRSRARRAGLGDEHGVWLAHLDLSGRGPIPDVPDGA